MYEDYYYYGYNTANSADGIIGTGFLIYMLVVLAVSVFQIICMWKVFKKAGKGGWECLIPVYSNIVMLEIAELPMWYLILYFLPFANIYVAFKVNIEIAHKFGKSTGFGVGMALLPVVFDAILAFDDSVYSKSSNVEAPKVGSNANGFCPNCGTQLDSETVFCPNCGNKVK